MTIKKNVDRRSQIIENLNLSGVGLEISPLFRPTILKKDHRVFYTDYTTTQELRKKIRTILHSLLVMQMRIL